MRWAARGCSHVDEGQGGHERRKLPRPHSVVVHNLLHRHEARESVHSPAAQNNVCYNHGAAISVVKTRIRKLLRHTCGRCKPGAPGCCLPLQSGDRAMFDISNDEDVLFLFDPQFSILSCCGLVPPWKCLCGGGTTSRCWMGRTTRDSPQQTTALWPRTSSSSFLWALGECNVKAFSHDRALIMQQEHGMMEGSEALWHV